jgi:hypothetical protein
MHSDLSDLSTLALLQSLASDLPESLRSSQSECLTWGASGLGDVDREDSEDEHTEDGDSDLASVPPPDRFFWKMFFSAMSDSSCSCKQHPRATLSMSEVYIHHLLGKSLGFMHVNYIIYIYIEFPCAYIYIYI